MNKTTITVQFFFLPTRLFEIIIQCSLGYPHLIFVIYIEWKKNIYIWLLVNRKIQLF